MTATATTGDGVPGRWISQGQRPIGRDSGQGGERRGRLERPCRKSWVTFLSGSVMFIGGRRYQWVGRRRAG